MEPSNSASKQWLDALYSALRSVAEDALDIEDIEHLGPRDTLPQGMESTYVALVGEKTSVQLGFITDEQGCQSLARSLMAMEPDEEDLEPDEVADAIKELANILAGQTKRAVSDRDLGLMIGIPILLKGEIKGINKDSLAAGAVRVGATTMTLLVITNGAG